MGVFFRFPETAAGQAWAGAELDITIGALNDTWVYNTQLGDLDSSPYDVLEDFNSWAAEAGRPWFGLHTFSRGYGDGGNGGVSWTLGCSTTATWAPNAAFQALTGCAPVVATTLSSLASSAMRSATWSGVRREVEISQRVPQALEISATNASSRSHSLLV